MSFLEVWFGWINFGLADVVQMAINVGIVYLLMFTVYYIIDIKQAGEINKMLQEKYGDEEVKKYYLFATAGVWYARHKLAQCRHVGA